MPRRLRELGVPLAVYLAVALGLPIVNGAARRTDFARHATGVLVGVALVVGAIALAGAGIETVLAGARRIANNRAARRVPRGGHE